MNSLMKINFTCATITGNLHLDEGSEKLKYGKVPVLDEIDGRVRAEFSVSSR
jgi:hypothetical protein